MRSRIKKLKILKTILMVVILSILICTIIQYDKYSVTVKVSGKEYLNAEEATPAQYIIKYVYLSNSLKDSCGSITKSVNDKLLFETVSIGDDLKAVVTRLDLHLLNISICNIKLANNIINKEE